MAFSEQFTAGLGTILGVQATSVANITVLSVQDIHIFTNNLGPQRTGQVLLNVDGELYLVNFTFTDETFDQRTLQGYPKKKNPKAVIR